MMLELGNEFAVVQIEIDTKGLSPRLKIRSVRTGEVGYLDPLELETLASLRHEDLKPLMDPGFRGWQQAENQSLSDFWEGLGVSVEE